MAVLTSKYTPPEELHIEARGALRAIVAICEECGPDRWGSERLPVDPRDALPDRVDAAVGSALLTACNAVAGIGCFTRDFGLSSDVLGRVVPAFQTVELIVTGMLAGLGTTMDAPVDDPGWTSVLEVLEAIQGVTQVALVLWAPAPVQAVAA